MTAAADQVPALSPAIVSQSVSQVQSGAGVLTITAVRWWFRAIVRIVGLLGLAGGGFDGLGQKASKSDLRPISGLPSTKPRAAPWTRGFLAWTKAPVSHLSCHPVSVTEYFSQRDRLTDVAALYHFC